VDKETSQSGPKENCIAKPSGDILKKSSLKLEVIAFCISVAAIPAVWLDDFLWGYDPQFFCCMSWVVRAVLLYAARYIVLPVLLLIIIFRLYTSWRLFNLSSRIIRFALLIAVALPIFLVPQLLAPVDFEMLGLQAKVAVTGGTDNLQKWAVTTIAKASQEVNDINDLNGKAVDRRLWSEQVRKLNPVSVSYCISNTGVPFINITLGISWGPRGISVGPPILQFGDANNPYPYEFYPGVYGN
jgi:hypothetical protein